MIELKDTVEMMLSDDWKERFKAEYWQLCIRIRKLKETLEKFRRDEIELTDNEYHDMEYQEYDMLRYLHGLEKRASGLGISLTLEEKHED